MRAISCLIWGLVLAPALLVHGQDAATEERLNKLRGQIEDLFAAQRAQAKRIEELAQAISDLREQLARPNPTYGTQEDLRRLADAVREIDQKRLEDYEKIRSELVALGKTLAANAAEPAAESTNAVPLEATNHLSLPPQENGPVEYVVQTNDSLSKIAQSFRREKNLKITVNDIVKANPGLVPGRIRPGQKILIPLAPPPDQVGPPRRGGQAQ